MKLRSVYFLGEVVEIAPPPGAALKCDGDAHKCPWWPYTNSKDFKANTALIVIVLINIALICGLALNVAIHYIIRTHCFRRHDSQPSSEELQDVEMERPKTVLSSGMIETGAEITGEVYSMGMKLARGESKCTICLSVFADGEKIRVLEKCSHGFHLQCLQQWLAAHTSCPTCRASCTL